MFVVYDSYGEIKHISYNYTPNSIKIDEETFKRITKTPYRYRVLNGVIVDKDSIEYKMWYYEKKIDEYLDSVAQSKGYDNRITATMRAGVEGSPYQAECKRFAIWADTVYQYCYQVLDDVLNGRRRPPTIEQLINELPKFNWEE